MAVPVIEWVRDGVGFTPPAAASFRRAEADLGRQIDVNSTYRDWYYQLSMYRAWQAYVNGLAGHPGHSRALHPDESVHTQGEALDSDDWWTPGFVQFMQDRGWIRTAAGDPTEQHHFEYQWWHDQHRNRPAVAGGTVQTKGDDDMSIQIRRKSDGLIAQVAFEKFAAMPDEPTANLVRNVSSVADERHDLDDAGWEKIILSLGIPLSEARAGNYWSKDYSNGRKLDQLSAAIAALPKE